MEDRKYRAPASALLAGFTYFAIVFTAGFALGALRTLIVAPRLGETGAVAAELPVMLAISFFACRFLVRRFKVPPRLSARAAMGAVAFALLMAAEFALSTLAFGRSAAEFMGAFATPAGLLGLGGQIAFALMPLFVRR